MVFLEKARSWQAKDLQKLVTLNITEDKYLEYKSLAALNSEAKDEISKDVSSFANSGGGLIIYGIREHKEGPSVWLELEEGLDPNSAYSKEWLENVIFSRISPKIEGLFINPIQLPTGKYAYAVIIPKSHTAHMSGTSRYYKRYNFKAEPMEDYEVRDVINRLGLPRLQLAFTVPKEVDSQGLYTLQLLLRNVGEAFVRHFALRICLPEVLLSGEQKGGRRIQLGGLWYREYIKQSDPNQYLFPGLRLALNNRFLPRLDATLTKSKTDLSIYWTIYTDKGGPQNGQTAFAVIIRRRLNLS